MFYFWLIYLIKFFCISVAVLAFHFRSFSKFFKICFPNASTTFTVTAFPIMEYLCVMLNPLVQLSGKDCNLSHSTSVSLLILFLNKRNMISSCFADGYCWSNSVNRVDSFTLIVSIIFEFQPFLTLFERFFRVFSER